MKFLTLLYLLALATQGCNQHTTSICRSSFWRQPIDRYLGQHDVIINDLTEEFDETLGTMTVSKDANGYHASVSTANERIEIVKNAKFCRIKGDYYLESKLDANYTLSRFNIDRSRRYSLEILVYDPETLTSSNLDYEDMGPDDFKNFIFKVHNSRRNRNIVSHLIPVVEIKQIPNSN